jgi:hypothetical protein
MLEEPTSVHEVDLAVRLVRRAPVGPRRRGSLDSLATLPLAGQGQQSPLSVYQSLLGNRRKLFSLQSPTRSLQKARF